MAPLAVVPPLLMLPDDVPVPLVPEALLIVAPDAVPPVVTVGAGVVSAGTVETLGKPLLEGVITVVTPDASG